MVPGWFRGKLKVMEFPLSDLRDGSPPYQVRRVYSASPCTRIAVVLRRKGCCEFRNSGAFGIQKYCPLTHT